jgi:hypothetical protein
MSIAERLELMADVTAENWKAAIRLCLQESRNQYGDIDPILLEKLLNRVTGDSDE